MKKFYLLLLCCLILLCGCNSDDESALFEAEISSLEEEIIKLKSENKELKDKNDSLTELASKYKESYDEVVSICYELLGEYEQLETKNNNNNDNDIEIIYPELPLEVSYMSSSGPDITCRIDKISYTYDKYSDGTCSLTLYFSGEKIYDKKGENSLNKGMLYAALYDENGNIVIKNDVSLSKIMTNEKFYDCDRIFLDIPLGHTYTLKIYDFD